MATPDMLIEPNMTAGAIAGLAALGVAVVLFLLLLLVAVYVYKSIALMTLARRMKNKNAWLAWISVGDLVLTSQLAKMPWWPVLFIIGTFIPGIGFLFSIALLVFIVIWIWKICEARNRPNWWAVLIIIPFVGWIWALVLLGILAWGE